MIQNYVRRQNDLVGSFLMDLLKDISATYAIPYDDLCKRYVDGWNPENEVSTCDGFKKNGDRCTHRPLPGTSLCKRHQYQTYNVRLKDNDKSAS